MPNTRMKNRYQFIDSLKAIAIFFVVIYHCNNLKYNITETQDVFSYLNYFSISILSVCVPIFFFVNGALLLNKELNLKKHIYKVIHIVILMIVWGSITLLFLMPINNEYMSLLEFAKSVWKLKLNWNDHLWFLQAMVVIYVFFPLIKAAYDSKMNYIYFFLAIAFLMTFGNVFLSNCANMIGFFIGKGDLGSNRNFFKDFNAFRGIYGFSFIYFILGGLFIKQKERFRGKQWAVIAATTIAISMLLLTLYGVLMTQSHGKVFDIVWNGYDTIPTLFMVLAISILSLNFNATYKILKLIKCVGENSLGIFFVHRIWGLLLLKYFKGISYSQNLITNLMFAIIITLISLLSVLLLKRIPIIKRLFVI